MHDSTACRENRPLQPHRPPLSLKASDRGRPRMGCDLRATQYRSRAVVFHLVSALDYGDCLSGPERGVQGRDSSAVS